MLGFRVIGTSLIVFSKMLSEDEYRRNRRRSEFLCDGGGVSPICTVPSAPIGGVADGIDISHEVMKRNAKRKRQNEDMRCLDNLYGVLIGKQSNICAAYEDINLQDSEQTIIKVLPNKGILYRNRSTCLEEGPVYVTVTMMTKSNVDRYLASSDRKNLPSCTPENALNTNTEGHEIEDANTSNQVSEADSEIETPFTKEKVFKTNQEDQDDDQPDTINEDKSEASGDDHDSVTSSTENAGREDIGGEQEDDEDKSEHPGDDHDFVTSSKENAGREDIGGEQDDDADTVVSVSETDDEESDDEECCGDADILELTVESNEFDF